MARKPVTPVASGGTVSAIRVTRRVQTGAKTRKPTPQIVEAAETNARLLTLTAAAAVVRTGKLTTRTVEAAGTSAVPPTRTAAAEYVQTRYPTAATAARAITRVLPTQPACKGNASAPPTPGICFAIQRPAIRA